MIAAHADGKLAAVVDIVPEHMIDDLLSRARAEYLALRFTQGGRRVEHVPEVGDDAAGEGPRDHAPRGLQPGGQLAATGQTVPNQLKQPTDRPTLRWIFQCFEGVSLVVFQPHKDHPNAVWLVWSPCTSRWPPYWDYIARNSTKSMTEAAKCGMETSSRARWLIDRTDNHS